MSEKGEILLAGPMVIQTKGSVDFRVVLREWMHDVNEDCIEWVCHKEFHPRNNTGVDYAFGQYYTDYDQAVSMFNRRWKEEIIKHDTTEAVTR